MHFADCTDFTLCQLNRGELALCALFVVVVFDLGVGLLRAKRSHRAVMGLIPVGGGTFFLLSLKKSYIIYYK